jgi:glycerol uptake facilitator-like aquaporin
MNLFPFNRTSCLTYRQSLLHFLCNYNNNLHDDDELAVSRNLRLLQALTPKDVRNSLGMTTISGLVTPLQGFFMEALITFVLVLTVEAVCDDRRTDVKGSAPLAIGLSITTCHLGAVSLILTIACIFWSEATLSEPLTWPP